MDITGTCCSGDAAPNEQLFAAALLAVLTGPSSSGFRAVAKCVLMNTDFERQDFLLPLKLLKNHVFRILTRIVGSQRKSADLFLNNYGRDG